ncbi:MAG: hypothetical protein AB1791_06140 [Chloroflexota bacterium]
MTFPTIFDWLERFAWLRGFPAAYVVLLAAFIIVVVGDWRVAIFALALQYLVSGLLFVDVLDPRLAIVKVLTGLFICLMLYWTARQVKLGGRPAAPNNNRYLSIGPIQAPLAILWRLASAALMAWLVWTLAQRPEYQAPFVPAHVNLAIYALAGLGLLGLSWTAHPFWAGLGLLTALVGGELLYSAVEQSVATLVLLAAVDLLVTLVIAYLTQAHHVIIT